MGIAENLKTLMAADLRAAIGDVSATLKIGDLTVTGTAGPSGASDAASSDGILPMADLEFVACKDDFTGKIPPVRAVVDVDGVRYWVMNATDDGAAVTLQLRRGSA